MRAERLLGSLTPITLDDSAASALQMRTGPLTLLRAWPRAARIPGASRPWSDEASPHLIFECRDKSGAILAGQWWRDRTKADAERCRILAANPLACAAVVHSGDDPLLLQAHGADADLPALASVLRRGGLLLAHRAGRRAVVRAEVDGGARFIKCMRPREIGAALRKASWIADLHASAFAAPELLAADEMHGTAVWRGLAGRSYTDLLRSGDDADVECSARAVGTALRSLHHAAPPPELTSHTAEAEAGVLRRWLDLLRAFFPHEAKTAVALCGSVQRGLAASPQRTAMIHRDFYDKQILVGADREVAFLDFDTLAVGDPAVDVGNFLAHLELLHFQVDMAAPRVALAARSFLEGYGSELHDHAQAYTDAARLRLACVHAFRPSSRAAAWRMLNAVGKPAPT